MAVIFHIINSNDQANTCLIHFYKRRTNKMPLNEIFDNLLLSNAVFNYLSLPDVKTAALVCKSWRELVECRKYWQGSLSPSPTPVLRIRDESIFSSPRIKSVRKFRIDSSDTDSKLVNLFFRFVSDNKDYEVEYLMCDNILLTTVPRQLANAMCRVVELWLDGGTKLSKRQSDHMFNAISQSTDLKLKKLILRDVIMPNLDPETFASALINLEEVCLGEAVLSEDHLQAVLSVIAKKPESILKHWKLIFLNHLSAKRVCKIVIAICRVHPPGFCFCARIRFNHGFGLRCFAKSQPILVGI